MVKLGLYLAVALGAALGGSLRLGLAEWWYVPMAFPVAALMVNIAGSFFIGVLAAASQAGGLLALSDWQQQFWITGFCGGLTTFSLFGLEVLQLVNQGLLLSAMLYLLLTVLGGIAACYLGMRWQDKLR